MRYFRLLVILVFVAALLFSGWATLQYNKRQNNDKPRIVGEDATLELSVADGKEALLQGLTAEDETDGDLTDKIMVASVSHFLEPGTVRAKYVVFDSHNNSDTFTRQIHYTDYVSPVFSLSKAPVYQKGENFDLLSNLSVTDVIDGDISQRIRVVSNGVSNYTPGVYPVVVEASNSYGETVQVQIMVTYLEKRSTAVSIKLHEYLVYVEQGGDFAPARWIASVTDRDHTPLDRSKVTVEGNLDTDTPGCYSLTYTYADGTLTGQTVLTVVVTGEVAE